MLGSPSSPTLLVALSRLNILRGEESESSQSTKGLAVLHQFEIPTTAWRVHATRSDLYRQAHNDAAAEVHRARAERIVLALANSFAPDDPVRTAFLAAATVRRIRTNESRSHRHQRPRPM
jgi:hypothetical protein